MRWAFLTILLASLTSAPAASAAVLVDIQELGGAHSMQVRPHAGAPVDLAIGGAPDGAVTARSAGEPVETKQPCGTDGSQTVVCGPGVITHLIGELTPHADRLVIDVPWVAPGFFGADGDDTFVLRSWTPGDTGIFGNAGRDVLDLSQAREGAVARGDSARADIHTDVELLIGTPFDDTLTSYGGFTAEHTEEVRGGRGNDLVDIHDGVRNEADCGGQIGDRARIGVGDTVRRCRAVVVFNGKGRTIFDGFGQGPEWEHDGCSAPVPIEGRPGAVMCVGTAAADELTGTPKADALDGLGGRDRIAGGRGADLLLGGAGRDVLFARDGTRDRVRCGPGRDVARVDQRDRVRGCERVLRLRRR